MDNFPLGYIEVIDLADENLVGIKAVSTLDSFSKMWQSIKNSLTGSCKEFREISENEFDILKSGKKLESTIIVAPEADPQPRNQVENNEPWRISISLRDQAVIDHWNMGYTASEIAKKDGRTSKRITNLITEFRKSLGADIVPYTYDRRKT